MIHWHLMKESAPLPRRHFLVAGSATATTTLPCFAEKGPTEPIIDIHQHTGYLFRSNKQLRQHQKRLGVTTTILLPAGNVANRPTTHNGNSNGLAAHALGNESSMQLAMEFPDEFRFGVNEVPDDPNLQKTLEKYLKAGAVVIGEQKFKVRCDSPHIWKIAEVAKEYDVPVLMHFEHNRYNLGIENFYKTLEKFPEVNFIGHAQTWWGTIDLCHTQEVMYPRSKVVAGGITDQLLSNYPNIYGDLSAGSGLNSMRRDEDHARQFLERHQDKLLYGSDCWDSAGQSKGCLGTTSQDTIRKLSKSQKIERKILHDNAKTLFKL